MADVRISAADYRRAVAAGGDMMAYLARPTASGARVPSAEPEQPSAPASDQGETALQLAVVAYLRRAMPDDVGFWFHVPNGGRRSRLEAARFVGLGVRAGVPDLVFVLPGGRVAWVELKAPGGGRLSDRQREVHATLRTLGHDVWVVTSLEQLEGLLRSLGVQLRVTVGGGA